jgi:23S rRNA (cytosine1962-C5)-methyltransferase
MAGIVVKPRARILHGHDWVFSSEVLKVFGNPADGDVISLKDGKDRLIGSAIYNSKSQIVARRFSRRRQDLDLDFFRRRIAQASEYRDRRNVDPNLRRIVWSESDGLPGVIIDRYGDHFVLQTLTRAIDLRKDLITAAMVDLFGDIVIVERNDAPVRKAEGLELRKSILQGTGSQIAIAIEGVKLELDLLHGQKTGFYLDQRHNYGIVARYAGNRRVLDCFTNQGAFALACARAGAADVTGVEESAENVAAAKRNATVVYKDEERTARRVARLSGITHARVQAVIERWLAGDFFMFTSRERRGILRSDHRWACGCPAFRTTTAPVRAGT